MRVLIVGAGAAGMMAALAARECGAEVTLLEKEERVGRKLSQTGNGRCNIINTGASRSHYHGEDPSFTDAALNAWTPQRILDRFYDMGLITTEEYGGRVYPHSGRADSVVDVLRFCLDAEGIELKLSCSVDRIQRGKRDLSIFYIQDGKHGILHADRVILACGGAAAPKLGGTDAGYSLAASLGHRVTGIRPALVQLTCADKECRALKGVRADGRVTVNGMPEIRSDGEIQFTEYGLSGPAVFDIARRAAQRPGTVVSIDLLPEMPEETLFEMLTRRVSHLPHLTAADLFTGMLQNRIGRVCVQRAGIALTEGLSGLAQQQLKDAAHAAKNFTFTVTGDMGLSSAQVTSGGLDTREFDPVTMESKLVQGLYACGELLDVDGDCGGFNLAWAWASGLAAGMAAGGRAC